MYVPNSCVTAISPLASNAKILFARVAASTVNSVDVIVFVLDSFIDRSTSSCNSCDIDVSLSKASSKELAGSGSFSIKSKPCV